MYMWEGPENPTDALENDGCAKDWITQETFDFYNNNQKVGRCGIEIQSHIKAFRGIHQFYPDS